MKLIHKYVQDSDQNDYYVDYFIRYKGYPFKIFYQFYRHSVYNYDSNEHEDQGLDLTIRVNMLFGSRTAWVTIFEDKSEQTLNTFNSNRSLIETQPLSIIGPEVMKMMDKAIELIYGED